MSSDKSPPQSNLLALLLNTAKAYREDIETHLATANGIPEVMHELNGGQRRLLTLIPPNGARGTELAERAGMTKQALGQLAAGLEQAALIRAVEDPADRRARVWVLTDDGNEAAAATRKTIQAVETKWRRKLGAADYDRLSDILNRATEGPSS